MFANCRVSNLRDPNIKTEIASASSKNLNSLNYIGVSVSVLSHGGILVEIWSLAIIPSVPGPEYFDAG
jgi:hypothetical protein